jgi:16S rRNA (cytosine967-C5)-methyltransferase
MKNPSYLLSAQSILANYKFPEPFHVFLKAQFKENKKYGSRDRKIISALLFGYFRIGQQTKLKAIDAMKIGAFISDELSAKLYEQFFEFGAAQYSFDYTKKIEWLATQNIILENHEVPALSDGISLEAYQQDILHTHNTFIRIRKNKKNIIETLQKKEINFVEYADNIIGFPDNINLKEVLTQQQDFVVQDASSASVTNLFTAKKGDKVWDCCAASGGKSIAMFDACNGIELFVSDVRYQILDTLKERFKHFDIKKFQAFPHNAAVPTPYANNNMPHGSFDSIICDAPCTGSGTWSRSPEQWYFLPETDIEYYTIRQQDILQNTWPFLKKGGTFYYITCSAFTAENEEVVANFLEKNTDAEVLNMQIMNGMDSKADTMFVAVFGKE